MNSFLTWLREERGCGIATCNQRLTALRTFATYARSQYTEYLFEAQRIIDIRAKKKPKPALEYLSLDDVENILKQPDISTKYGRRDLLLLSLMYDSGVRVQEICDLRVRDVRLQKPSTITLTGKGDKTRSVPIMASTADILVAYFTENNFSLTEKADQPLFSNHRHEKLTKAGVTYILKKYSNTARITNPNLPFRISPHTLRHSKAMHMLQGGINLVYIRDFLGHDHVETTEIYAKADTDMKRKAIEEARIQIESPRPTWTNDKNLMSMLTGLCGK